MTQHLFTGTGRKRYGPINWIVFLDDEHIVLNTYIKDHKVKVNEEFLDEHWNIFVTKYNYNIDVWNMNKSGVEEFNDYRGYLLPDQSSLTLVDFDEAMGKMEDVKNEKKNLIRKIQKMEAKLDKLEAEVSLQVSEIIKEIRELK